MPHDYSEDQLIQRSAADFMEQELGWASVYAYDKEVLGVNGTLGRTSYHEVLLSLVSGINYQNLNWPSFSGSNLELSICLNNSDRGILSKRTSPTA